MGLSYWFESSIMFEHSPQLMCELRESKSWSLHNSYQKEKRNRKEKNRGNKQLNTQIHHSQSTVGRINTSSFGLQVFSMETQNKSKKCSQCNYASVHAGNLKMHLKTHTARALKVDSIIHAGEKANKCNQCDYESIQAGNLRTHILRKHIKGSFQKLLSGFVR